MRRILKSGCLLRFGFCAGAGETSRRILRRFSDPPAPSSGRRPPSSCQPTAREASGHIGVRGTLRRSLKQVLEGSPLRRRHNRRRTRRRLDGRNDRERLHLAGLLPPPAATCQPKRLWRGRAREQASESSFPSVSAKTYARPFGRPRSSLWSAAYRDLNRALISAKERRGRGWRNVPKSAISVAAWRKPVHAARASAPPTLIRLTPSRLRSATVAKSLPTRTFTGFGATAPNDGRDVACSANPRRIQALCASLCVGGQPADCLGQVRPTDDEALRTRGQEHTGLPVASMAWRAARMRSTAKENSKRGSAGSPVESSIERPAMPVAVAAVTFDGNGARVRSANPPSKSAFTGMSTPWAIERM